MTMPCFIGWPENPAGRRALTLAAVLLGVVATIVLWPAGRRGLSGSSLSIVYVCTETNETFLEQFQSVPAVNPKTGRRTLVRGVYCPKCNRWYASTPSPHRSGNPRTQYCRIHHVAMTYSGPTDSQSGSGP